MTVAEAAQLVIQAGAMGEKAEVFVLDMGESVKIRDLIYKMIKLSGFSVKDEENLNGDIEVKVVGLRPGEKLFEELLIGDNPQKTRHSKIKKISEPFIPMDQLEEDLLNLKVLLDSNMVSEVKVLLEKLLNNYKSNSEIVDHIFVSQLSVDKYNKKNISK